MLFKTTMSREGITRPLCANRAAIRASSSSLIAASDKVVYNAASAGHSNIGFQTMPNALKRTGVLLTTLAKVELNATIWTNIQAALCKEVQCVSWHLFKETECDVFITVQCAHFQCSQYFLFQDLGNDKHGEELPNRTEKSSGSKHQQPNRAWHVYENTDRKDRLQTRFHIARCYIFYAVCDESSRSWTQVNAKEDEGGSIFIKPFHFPLHQYILWWTLKGQALLP